MTFVSGVTSVDVISGGSGYFTDHPAIVFVPPVGSPGSGATATLTTNGGNILAVNVTAGGTGYQPVSATLSVSSIAGVGAILQPLVNGNGNIVNINIANNGTGYTINDTITATRAVAPNVAYVNAVFQITAVSLTGQIISIAIINPGSGYQPSVATVKIVSSFNSALAYPTGAGFMANVVTNNVGTVTSVIVTNTGSGYADLPPTLVITDPGTGAVTKVTLGTGLTATSVASIAVLNSGSGYTSAATGQVINPSTDAGVSATGTPIITAGSIVGVSSLMGGGVYASTPTITFSNAIGTGTGATATVVVSAGVVTSIALNSGGTGYTNGTYTGVKFTNAIGAGTGATVNMTVVGGIVTSVTLATGGTGYSSGTSILTLGTIVPGAGYTNGSYSAVPLIGGTGTGATANIVVAGGTVTSVSIVNRGVGYTLADNLSATLPAGSGFIIPVSQVAYIGVPFATLFNTLATGTANMTAGSVSSVTITNGGSGYNAATMTFSPPIIPPITPAVVKINVATNTFGTNPNLYWQVWAGTTTNKAIQLQENAVLSYFKGLGYTISIQSNPATGSTIQWKICW